MGKLTIFDFISINGFYKGPGEDISWNSFSDEERQLSVEMLEQTDILLFGRITSELMADYWPTESARKGDPLIAEKMNALEKIVFSRTLTQSSWNNTRMATRGPVEEVKFLKSAGKRLTLLGSGTILTQLAEEDLIDEYRILIYPVALTAGTPIFPNLKANLKLKLWKSQTFSTGSVMLWYQSVLAGTKGSHAGEK